MTETTFTCVGPVRGCCGHEHKTPGAAFACCARDQRGCQRQGGYSDRRILAREPYHRDAGAPELGPGGSWTTARNARILTDDEIHAAGPVEWGFGRR